MARKATIKISAAPDSKLRAALNGTVTAARKTNRRVKSDSIKSAKSTQTEKAKIGRDEVRAAARAGAMMRREGQKTERAAIRSARKVLRERERTDKKAADSRKRNRRTALAGAAGGAFGAARGAGALVGRGQAFAGVGSLEERLGVAIEFDKALVRVTKEAGVSAARRIEIENTLLKASKDSQTPLLDLANGLRVAQSEYAPLFDVFASVSPQIAEMSRATGALPEDLIRTVGAFAKAAKITTASGLIDIMDRLASTAASGAISIKAMGTAMAPVAGLVQSTTARKGIDQVNETFSLIQLIGGSGARPDEVATLVKQFTESIADPKVQKRLKQAGVTVADEDQRLLDFDTIIANLSEKSQDLRAPGKLEKIFGGREIARAATFVLQGGTETFRSISESTGGAEFIAATALELNVSKFGKLTQIGVDAQVKTIADAERIVSTITPAIKKMTELQLEFPLLTESMDTLGETFKLAAGAIVASSLLGGGVAAAGVAGVGGAAAGAGAGLAGAGAVAAGVLGTVAAAGAAGAAGFLITRAIVPEEVAEGVGASLFSEKGAAAERQGPTSLSATRVLNRTDPLPKERPTPTQELKASLKVEVDDKRVRVTQVTTDTGVDLDVRSGISTFR